jgi:hypothetical protein
VRSKFHNADPTGPRCSISARQVADGCVALIEQEHQELIQRGDNAEQLDDIKKSLTDLDGMALVDCEMQVSDLPVCSYGLWTLTVMGKSKTETDGACAHEKRSGARDLVPIDGPCLHSTWLE